MLKGLRVVVAALGIVGVSAAAHAHVSLEAKQAKVGGSYKAVFGIPHGCEGQPTTEVSIEIPEGVIGVKPMPKPGWTLALEKGTYARTYKFHHGETKSDGVKRVTWSGGPLPDEYFDQFVLSTFIAREMPPDTRIYFPVTQKCASSELRWSEVPAEGQDAHGLEYPAPGLALISDEVKKQDKIAEAMAVAGGAIEIGQPWTRPVGNAGGVGAGYAIITNNGTEADELLGGSSDSAERVEMHETSIDDKGVASMKKLGSVPLQSGQSIELKPGSMHIMFIGLKEPQKEGGILKAKLKFKKAGEVDVEFAVKVAGPGSAGGHGGHDHMHHDH